jgi:hypothetical protein
MARKSQISRINGALKVGAEHHGKTFLGYLSAELSGLPDTQFRKLSASPAGTFACFIIGRRAMDKIDYFNAHTIP